MLIRLHGAPPRVSGWRAFAERVGWSVKSTRDRLGVAMGVHTGRIQISIATDGRKNAQLFFEVYSKWTDGAANPLGKGQMRSLVDRLAFWGITRAQTARKSLI